MYSNEFNKALIELYAVGNSMRSVAQEAGCSVGHVANVVRDAGKVRDGKRTATAKTKQILAALSGSSEPIVSIAKRHGVTPQRVHQIMKKHESRGVEVDKRRVRRRRIDVEAVAKMLRDGLHVNEIAVRMKCSIPGVKSIKKRLGIR